MQSEPDPRKWLYQEEQELQKLRERLAKKSLWQSKPIWIATGIAIAAVFLVIVLIQSWETLVAFFSRLQTRFQ